MKKQLCLIITAFALNGCILSGPMALLPPSAKFLMWQANEDIGENNQSPISVQELLKNARGFSSETERPSSIVFSYDDYTLNDERVEHISRFKTTTFEMVCGPYEFGNPLKAAMTALKSCGGLKQELSNRGLSVSVRFDPNAPKGQATLKPLLMIEEDNA